MELNNKTINGDLGACYRNIESHTNKIQERKAQIAVLRAEMEQDKHSVVELKKKLEELEKELV